MLAPIVVALGLMLPAPDYAGFYAQGMPFSAFLETATALADEWHDIFDHARIEEASVTRARALSQPWRILVVAEDSCHDSLNTLPYLARLVEASPDTLSMRIVKKAIGLPVMEAHKTPDGRPATPTIVVLDAAGGVKGVISERPAALWEFSREHSARGDRRQWYADDKGRHAVSELLDIIEK